MVKEEIYWVINQETGFSSQNIKQRKVAIRRDYMDIEWNENEAPLPVLVYRSPEKRDTNRVCKFSKRFG
jgi:hypothetical protein